MKKEKRVAIVTGGGRGIGRAVAADLLEHGYRIAVFEVNPDLLSRLNELFAAYPDAFLGIGCDVGNAEDVKASVAQVLATWGRIDVLVNNAAISVNKPLSKLTLEEWENVLRINLTGPMLMARECETALRANRGVIINLGSTRAYMSEPNTEAYSASKGGIVALTHALAVSLGPDVRVNCICPGWIDTRQWRESEKEPQPLREIDHAQHPAGRVGRPEDIAAMVRFLISEDAGFITGMSYVVDGGMTIRMYYEP
ncbi:MAG: SDR family oxidoreductase [Lentisphaerae bacterium]|nr:MAG: SDR family oxidoreductase [Lentisphaerota bacterium]